MEERGRNQESATSSAASTVQVLGRDDVVRATTRMAHEILERHKVLDGIVLIGIQRGGGWIAETLQTALSNIQPECSVRLGSVDVSLFRDDISLRPVMSVSASDIPVDLTGVTVILVDDVLFTGRTVRAALDALTQYGRPARVQLAVMVDRGHRELPIRPDFVGKNIPTSSAAEVFVSPEGVWISEDAQL